MIYVWECKCGEETEVQRPTAEINVPPEACKACGDKELARIPIPKRKDGQNGFILQGDGWFRDNFTASTGRSSK